MSDTGSAAEASTAGAGSGSGQGTTPPQGAGPGGPDGHFAGDAPGPYDAAAAEAFRRGRQVLGPETSVLLRHGGTGYVHVGDLVISLGGAAAPIPGPVQLDVLERLADDYLPVDGYGDLLDRLRSHHLLILKGRPHSGRSTTALRLLDDASRRRVSRFNADTDLRSLAVDLVDEGRGYLGDLPDSRGRRALDESHLDRLAALLRDKDAYCVLIADADSRRREAVQGYAMPCSPPDQHRLLVELVRRGVQPADDVDLEDRIATLLDDDRLMQVLGPDLMPREIASLASPLLEYARRKVTLQKIEDRCAQLREQQVAEWFGRLSGLKRGEEADDVVAFVAFVVALAVLDGSPYHDVCKAADALAAVLNESLWPNRIRGQVPAGDPGNLVAAARARTERGSITYGYVDTPAECVRYNHESMPSVVLACAWAFPHLRSPILQWLGDLATEDQYIAVRAAQGAGLLCSIDFTAPFAGLIHRFAGSTDEACWEQQRWFAAVALDHAAQYEQVAPVVEELIKIWKRRGPGSLRYTAATVLGFPYGLRSVDETLAVLKVLGSRQQVVGDDAGEDEELEDLRWAAGRSLARLLVTGARHDVVLPQLDSWMRNNRWSLRILAAIALHHSLWLRVGDLRDIAFLAPESPAWALERRRWPVLVALIAHHAELRDPVVRLVRAGFRGQYGKHMTDGMAKWFEVLPDDEHYASALVSFVRAVSKDPWVANCLRDRIRRGQGHWAEPLKAATAHRLLEATSRA